MYVQLLEIIYSYKKTEWEKDSTRRKEKRINRRKKTRVSKIQKKKSAETKCQYLETDHISTSFIDNLLKLGFLFFILFNNYNSSKGKFTKSDRLHGVMPTVAFEI